MCYLTWQTTLQVNLIAVADLCARLLGIFAIALVELSFVIAFLASGLAPHATGTTIDINGASYIR